MNNLSNYIRCQFERAALGNAGREEKSSTPIIESQLLENFSSPPTLNPSLGSFEMTNV